MRYLKMKNSERYWRVIKIETLNNLKKMKDYLENCQLMRVVRSALLSLVFDILVKKQITS